MRWIWVSLKRSFKHSSSFIWHHRQYFWTISSAVYLNQLNYLERVLQCPALRHWELSTASPRVFAHTYFKHLLGDMNVGVVIHIVVNRMANICTVQSNLMCPTCYRQTEHQCVIMLRVVVQVEQVGVRRLLNKTRHSYLPMLAITTHDAISLTHASNPHTHSESVVDPMNECGIPIIIPCHLSLHLREIELVDASPLKKR